MLLLKLVITDSMVQNQLQKLTVRSASQGIPRLSRNPKVHYRVHESSLPVPIPSHMNPDSTLTPLP
jgi:hypothetical protein